MGVYEPRLQMREVREGGRAYSPSKVKVKDSGVWALVDRRE